ncbi:hypothetical protein BgiBS90_005404, partial [Biomphalaria glabrata]
MILTVLNQHGRRLFRDRREIILLFHCLMDGLLTAMVAVELSGIFISCLMRWPCLTDRVFTWRHGYSGRVKYMDFK